MTLSDSGYLYPKQGREQKSLLTLVAVLTTSAPVDIIVSEFAYMSWNIDRLIIYPSLSQCSATPLRHVSLHFTSSHHTILY